MSDPPSEPTQSTEDLLRQVAGELRLVRIKLDTISQNVVWLVLIGVAMGALAALWLFGVITIEFRPVDSGF